MPFETLENLTKDNMPPTASVSYLRYVRKESDRGKSKPRLLVSLPTRVVVTKHERFIVQVGTGADAKKLRVVGVLSTGKNAPRSSVRANVFKTHLMIRFGHIPRLADEIFQQKECPVVRIDDDTYEIDTGVEILPAENVVEHPQLKRA